MQQSATTMSSGDQLVLHIHHKFVPKLPYLTNSKTFMSESHVNKRLLSKDISLSENVYSMGSPRGTFFVLFSLSHRANRCQTNNHRHYHPHLRPPHPYRHQYQYSKKELNEK